MKVDGDGSSLTTASCIDHTLVHGQNMNELSIKTIFSLNYILFCTEHLNYVGNQGK